MNLKKGHIASCDNSSEVTMGKWMVGIGLTIGALLLFLNYSVKEDQVRSVSASAKHQAIADTRRSIVPTSQQLTQDYFSNSVVVVQSLGSPEEVEVLGQRIIFNNPSGYCSPGMSTREVELMNFARNSLGDSVRLIHAAVLCSELEEYRSGQRDTLDHWLQIQLIGLNGKFNRIEIDRETFLTGISKSSPRLNSAEINQRLQFLINSGLSISKPNIEMLGRDGNAVYFSTRMAMSVGDISRSVTSLSGITLLNSLPLSISVYEGLGSLESREQLQPVLQELLNSLLTEN